MKKLKSPSRSRMQASSSSSCFSSEDHLLDVMEDELRLAYKMVQELKNAPRASPRKGQKPCCFCSNAIQLAEQPNLMNASDMSPDPFCTSPPLRSSARSTTSPNSLFTPRRPSRTASHVSHRLFDVKMETPGNPDGLMMAVDKFLASGDFLPPT